VKFSLRLSGNWSVRYHGVLGKRARLLGPYNIYVVWANEEQMIKRLVWSVIGLIGLVLLVVAFLGWRWGFSHKFEIFLADQKMPRILETQVESFRSSYRPKSGACETTCFNTWELVSIDGQSIIYGMNSPMNFGRTNRGVGFLWLASQGGTIFDVLFIPFNLRNCEEMASHLSNAANGGWKFEGLVTGYQDQGAYFEQRTYDDLRNVSNRADKIFHHCQRYADATISVISYVNPQDPALSTQTISELLKTVRISYKKWE
jgi:hypothetical protein